MVQGGYSSPSSQKSLSVSKKSNILDKSPRKTTSNSNASSRRQERESSPVSSGINVSNCLSYFKLIKSKLLRFCFYSKNRKVN